MAPAGNQQEVVERVDELVAAPHFVSDLFFFGAPDFSLDRILGKIFEKFFEFRAEIQFMKIKRLRRLKLIAEVRLRRERPKFQVLAVLASALLDELLQQPMPVFGIA